MIIHYGMIGWMGWAGVEIATGTALCTPESPPCPPIHTRHSGHDEHNDGGDGLRLGQLYPVGHSFLVCNDPRRYNAAWMIHEWLPSMG